MRSLLFHTTAVLLVLSSACLSQQTAVSPREYANTEMAGVADLSGVPSYRFQQVYDASDFAHLGSGPLTITRIDWRPDGTVTEPLTTPSPDWLLTFSTTTKNPGELDATFANNTGVEPVQVIAGPVTLTTENLGPTGGPKVFDYGVDLTTPYVFDPSTGNLLMDLTIRESVGPLLLDYDPPATQSTSFIWTGGLGPDSPESDGLQYGGHVIQFTIVPEPEFAAGTLSLLASSALLARRRRRS